MSKILFSFYYKKNLLLNVYKRPEYINPKFGFLCFNFFNIGFPLFLFWDIYSNNKITPFDTINGWNNFLRKLYIFDGIKFSLIQNYFDMRKEYIKAHYRFTQPHDLAYATVEHAGFHTERYIEHAFNFNIKQIGLGFAHETGYMMDVYERCSI